ncbi:protein adenylyltransferase SelO [Tenacibaculum finnmarkense]|uniref:Protein nucleotidyltransferase YdiU n=1 Tax=Tenacibaculum finnmarkense genomovar finnmarkense TaxID=1458503 RepID=A0AAP1WGK0_9FLAO|nr:YdiU family protein [Tenacibaculum finnmarkense]MBE7653176.1 YdiU family protein [Tenacibaculum finnmarkense genomovar finnmarkense]MBE7695454.1 YdiU family protein [Tenacibaculum finnmarkense genomovar finnmarkense]MCD8427586.1 YdiU family protein [Tenacibaculum finnmarkense genomovar finnmarkense]MCG8731380.1 YdiU family protein [Tenacibaculum finnmarkense]MCG8751929.1 YdiU family protein [Tenacibaculum finnmarkense]
MKLNIQDTFTKELPADKILENTRRQVLDACFSFVEPKKTANPKLLHVSEEMLTAIGLTKEDAKSEDFVNIFTGNKVLENTHPFAMCYGGHQFGNWAGQLGDGRAINLTEVVHNKKRWAIQLKGAGETPYSRTADGLAVLRSSVREYLCSEAMFHLGVPTTRALSLSLSGDDVLRDMLYNGNAAYEKGAIVSRLAPSFIRFGSFEILSSRKNYPALKKLADYTIANFYPEIKSEGKQKYLDFLTQIRNRTIEMIVHWQRVGFVHGVMNTDNMSILGLTIDYGPYGWLEGYDAGWTPNTTDNQHKRYRYGNQSQIGIWNLFQLANALFPLIEEAPPLQEILDEYADIYQKKYLKMMTSKIGLFSEDANDYELIGRLEETLQLTETDMTIFFRNLALISSDDTFETAFDNIKIAFYTIIEVKDEIKNHWQDWFERYLKRLQQETFSDSVKKEKMNAINPKYVLRNYMAQLAIDAANKGDYNLIDELYELLKKPYDEQEKHEKWFAKRPEWARNKVGCSALSCSS